MSNELATVHDQGETGLAVATLQRLGEDIETSLKQLIFGTVRRSLQMRIVEVMKGLGYLGPHEWQILEKISLIEVGGIIVTKVPVIVSMSLDCSRILS